MQAGHVEVRFAFGSGAALTGRGVRESVVRTVTESLAFYEETFGPYPYDHLTVATARRGFSQGLPTFVTLSDWLLNDAGMWNRMFGLEDRRLVIAHEMAHQWWGGHVGWASYRDQWFSEAVASYAALLYARARLGNELTGVDLTEGWRGEVTAALPDGSPLESVGPVVLGPRLESTRASGAYQAIVYRKGAVVLDMLARSLGQDVFPKVLRQVVKVSGGKTISTEDLLSMIETVTSADLDGFARQFVYGTGLPEVVYSYRFEKKGSGWVVRGQARQLAPFRYRFRVAKTGSGAFDVVREAVRQIDTAKSVMVVPVQIGVYDPQGGRKVLDGANSLVSGHIRIQGVTSDFEMELPHEPKRFWLDRDSKVFGLFYDEVRQPKRALYLRGLRAASSGEAEEAAALYARALEARDLPPDTGGTVYYENLREMNRLLSGLIEVGQARLLLDHDREAEAEAALGRAQRTLGDNDPRVRLLRSRLEVRRGEYDKAFRRLRKELIADESMDAVEGYVLLAIAAQATGQAAELETALRKARDAGADLASLGSR